jgi:hypothetical protein
MPKTTVMDNEYITIWYHTEEKIVHHKFHTKTIYGKTFRDALNTGAELLKNNKACKWLSDDRNNVIFAQEDLLWGIEEWQPKVLKYGWKYWAIVKPLDEIGRMNTEQISYDYKIMGITIEYFDEVNKAFEWLCGVK